MSEYEWPWGEEEWPDGGDTFVGVCDVCGERRPVQEATYPFVAEGIHEPRDDNWRFWCRPCFSSRSGDV